jgi:hypothetical protein
MKYIVLGCGKFGKLAISRLIEQFERPEIVAVDTDLGLLKELPSDITAVEKDVVEFLIRAKPAEGDILIPMVPFHFAARYWLAWNCGLEEVALPEGIDEQTPHPFRVSASTMVCSKADFICPDDCPEGETCTVTGALREPLFDELSLIKAPGWKIIVLRSRQILPGIGGFSARNLYELGAEFQEGPNLLATSCKCHGVVTALQKSGGA